MNALTPITTSGMSWHERVAVAKANPDLAHVLICIVLDEADRRGESDAVSAAQYCLDTMADDPKGCFDELDFILADDGRFERLTPAKRERLSPAIYGGARG